MNAITNIKAVVKRELSAYFSSPVAYVFIVIFLLLTGFFTFMAGNFFERGQANLDSFFMWHPWLYVVFVPCVGMRLWAEERRTGTIELLLTKPVSPWQAVTGKFLASWIFLGLSLVLTFPVFITVNFLGSPDNGAIIAAYLGSFLLAGTYLAISCMTSAMTRNQVISFVISVLICLFLVLCGYPPVTNLLTRLDKPWIVDLVSSMSVMTHFQSFAAGMIDSRDLIFYLLVIAFALFTNGVIIRSHRAWSPGGFRRRNFESLLYSTAGVAAMFVIMIAIYVVTSAAKVRWDITADKIHTLSPGTKSILAHLDSRVTLRFYCTQSDSAMPPALRTYARHVEDVLTEFETQAKGKLVIERFDPRPDSDAEESAHLNGIDGRATGAFDSDRIYLGLAVNLLAEKFTLPWLAPERERFLEYDIARAISRVVSSRPVVGIMTALPVFGHPPDPLMRPGKTREEEWTFVSELKKDFTVREVPLSATDIDEQIKVLLVVHPLNISDAAQYAIDQFVLRGGKLLAFLDPHAYFDQGGDRNQNYMLMGDNASHSSLDKLLNAWGLSLDVNKVVADTTFAGRNMQSGDTMPTLLVVTREGIDENDMATSQIDKLFMPFPGAFIGQPAAGLRESVLVRTSPNSELVDNLIATAAARQILRDFQPSNVEYPLAVRLSGKFKTAFPNGRPKGEGGKEQVDDPAQLKESHGAGEAVLVADTDMLNDKVCVQVQYVMGQKMVHPMNGNLNFVQSLTEQFIGDDNLISARNRAGMSRPFTRLKEMENKAGRQWNEKVRVLEVRQRETERSARELQAQPGSDQGQGVILSAQQQKELDGYRKTLVDLGHELKQVRKSLRKDTDALEFWTKAINIAAMPLAVAFSGVTVAAFKARRRSRAGKPSNQADSNPPPRPDAGTKIRKEAREPAVH